MKHGMEELHYQVLRETSRGRRLVKLDHPFTYRCWAGDDSGGGTSFSVAVPGGFVSDLTSVPRVLWPLLPPDGEYQEAAVLHDYLYSLDVPQWWCDAVFRHVMQFTGVPMWKRVLLFWGVRIGGRWARRWSMRQSC